ncbi:MAG TPA: glycosyltransferase family 4 protein [Puia sp.]|nr:glycosyltransferase family 4 protein [Puia sp.]
MTDSRKSILIFTDWYEPGYKAGGPIQSVRNFVSAMHELYRIFILTSDRDLGAAEPYPGIPANEWIPREPGIEVYYATTATLNLNRIRELIQSKQPDFIYLNSLYSYRFTILPLRLLLQKKEILSSVIPPSPSTAKALTTAVGLRRAKPSTVNPNLSSVIHHPSSIILSPRGMLRESAVNHKGFKKKLFIAALRFLRIPERLDFHATDEQEVKDIRHHFPRARRVELIPNFSAPLPASVLRITKQSGELRCLYISRIMPIKNIGFFLQVLAALPASAQLSFDIYGDIEDEKYWQQARRSIALLPAGVKVQYHGSLPHEQVVSTIAKHHLFVLPTLGENFGHAIFESFAAGRPVLISDRTPWLNLQDQQLGWDLPLDNPEAWQAALQEAMAADQETFDRWTVSCRRFAEGKQNKAALIEAYTNLFN